MFDPTYRRDNLRELSESADTTPRGISESADGKMTTYAYRGHTFTVQRGAFMWWCHSGAHRNGDLTRIEHEAGWGSLTHSAVVRKLRRAIDRRLRDEGRRMECRA